jgi:hypothetical protein
VNFSNQFFCTFLQRSRKLGTAGKKSWNRASSKTGLPDGIHIFRPKSQLWFIWNGKFWYIVLTFGIFKVVCRIELPFGIFCGHSVYFLPFWCVVARKIWQP